MVEWLGGHSSFGVGWLWSIIIDKMFFATNYEKGELNG
jgi:hypothetical protein